MYGWSFQTIAEMTPYQQWKALVPESSDPDEKYVTFQTYDEYRKWLAKRG